MDLDCNAETISMHQTRDLILLCEFPGFYSLVDRSAISFAKLCFLRSDDNNFPVEFMTTLCPITVNVTSIATILHSVAMHVQIIFLSLLEPLVRLHQYRLNNCVERERRLEKYRIKYNTQYTCKNKIHRLDFTPLTLSKTLTDVRQIREPF